MCVKYKIYILHNYISKVITYYLMYSISKFFLSVSFFNILNSRKSSPI